MKYLSSCQSLVSILLEVLRHSDDIRKIDSRLVFIVIASDGVWSSASEE